MKKAGKYAVALLLCLIAQVGMAQQVEMADKLRSEGKIYVVVAIILIVLGGLILYLFSMDRKISKLEKLIHQKKQTKQSA